MATADADAPRVTPADPATTRRVLARLRRAQGQLAAVIRAVEAGEPCRDVVTQLAATSKALDRAGVMLISSALQECVGAPPVERAEGHLTPDELERLFMMFA